eukprot:11766840-Ditylum_brightwellii.AAC.2
METWIFTQPLMRKLLQLLTAKKKELNKFEALYISSKSNKDNGSDSNSKISDTSEEDIDSE